MRDCKEWPGGKDPDGYGITRVHGRSRRVPRVEWEKHNGPIPAGMLVCHRCDNPPCFEITHLFLGTPGDNMRDMVAKGRHRWLRNGPHERKTHCPEGHEFAGDNLYIHPTTGSWICRTCSNASSARYYKRKKAS